MVSRMMRKNGQATTELMILYAVVIVALVFMMGLLGRHSKGYVMNQAKQMSDKPWGDSAVWTSNSTSNSTTTSSATTSTTDSSSDSGETLNLNALP